MNDKIEAWIDRLDKYNICPYAAKSRRCIVEGDYNNFYTSKYNNYEIEINKEYLNQ